MAKNFVNNKNNYKAGNKTNGSRNTKWDAETSRGEKVDKYQNGTNDKDKFGNNKVCTNKGMNDPSWYAANPKLLDLSASFSYSTPLGSPYRLDRLFGSNIGSLKLDPTSASIPGVMAIKLLPVPGLSIDAQSPLNVAAQNIYSFVRHQNSGSANYDAPDYMLYLLACDSAYCFFNWMKRLYGLISNYDQLNEYLPRTLVEANGVDYDSIRDNARDFCAYINDFAANVTAFNVPAVMNLFLRHSWLFSNVYLDSTTPKAQAYEFVPKGFFIYDEKTSPKGGILKCAPIAGFKKLMTLDDIIRYGNTMINSMFYSEDIGVMSGDTLKAYGSSGLFTLSPTDINYTVTPVYNEEVLTQIHNLRKYDFKNYADVVISQDPNTNFLKFNPEIDPETVDYFSDGIMVNMPYKEILPADTMVATRLAQTAIGIKDGGTLHAWIGTCGSEIVTEVNMYKFISPVDSAGKLTYRSMTLEEIPFSASVQVYSDNTREKELAVVKTIVAASAFDWAPMVGVNFRWTGDTNTYSMGYIGDFNMYTIIDLPSVESMNLTAMKSLFGIPYRGSF